MPLQAGDVSQTVFIRGGKVAFHIPGRQTHHAAQHGHGRGEVGAVALLGVHQKVGHKVQVGGLVFYRQGIAEVAAQVVLNGEGLLIGRIRAGDDLPRQVIHHLLQVVRQFGILGQNVGVIRVICQGTGINQGAQPSIPCHKEGSTDGVGIPGLQVMGGENFAGIVEVGDKRPAGV